MPWNGFVRRNGPKPPKHAVLSEPSPISTNKAADQLLKAGSRGSLPRAVVNMSALLQIEHAKLKAKDFSSSKPPSAAIFYSPFQSAVAQNRLDEALRLQSSFDSKTYSREETPEFLEEMIQNGNVEAVEFLFDLSLDLHQREKKAGWPSLFKSIELNQYEVLSVLIFRCGAELDVKNEEGLNPVFYALLKDKLGALSYLMQVQKIDPLSLRDCALQDCTLNVMTFLYYFTQQNSARCSEPSEVSPRAWLARAQVLNCDSKRCEFFESQIRLDPKIR